MSLPPQVERYLRCIDAIPGVAYVDANYIELEDIPPSELKLLEHADLPLASLRRTPSKRDEMLFLTRFTIERNEQGLRALELLAWWARDQSRGGEQAQLRALARPPLPQQPKPTLRFHLEYFREYDGEEGFHKFVGELADQLEFAKAAFPAAFSA